MGAHEKPKTGQDSPKRAQETPKRPQGSPREPQESPREPWSSRVGMVTISEISEEPQLWLCSGQFFDLKRAQESPKRAQDGPKTAQHSPERAPRAVLGCLGQHTAIPESSLEYGVDPKPQFSWGRTIGTKNRDFLTEHVERNTRGRSVNKNIKAN